MQYILAGVCVCVHMHRLSLSIVTHVLRSGRNLMPYKAAVGTCSSPRALLFYITGSLAAFVHILHYLCESEQAPCGLLNCAVNHFAYLHGAKTNSSQMFDGQRDGQHIRTVSNSSSSNNYDNKDKFK